MSGAVLESLGWVLLHLVWQGALVAALLAVALAAIGRRSSSLRYLLACGALGLMLALPIATGLRQYASLSSQAEAPALRSAPAATLRATPLAAARAPAVARAAASVPVLEQAQAFVREHIAWLVLAWGLGVTLSSLRLLTGWLKLRRLVREAEPAPAEWQETLERLARRLELSRAVRLLQSAALEVPAAVGWLRPVVLLPMSALTGLSARQLEMVLAHELAHIRRYDFAVNMVQTLVETLLFYHPAVWWISRVIRAEREFCCDDIAVRASGNAVSYARALTALEALRVLPLGAASPAMSALGGGPLTDRVLRLLGSPRASFSSRCVPVASLLTLVSGLAVAAPLAALVAPVEAVQMGPASASATPGTEVTEPTLPAAPAPAAAPAVRAKAPPRVALAAPEPHVANPNPNPTPNPNPNPNPNPHPHRDHDRDRDHDGDKDEDEDNTRVDGRQLSVDQLVALKSAGITPERIKELESLGYEPTVGNLVQLGHAEVTTEYVKEMSAALGQKPTPAELLEMKTVGVTPATVQTLKAAGYPNLKAEDLAQAAAVGVDERFIRELKDAGYDKVPFEELVQLRAVGVSSKYVQELKAAGYANIPAEELSQLRAVGVTPEYIRALREAGLDKLTVDELQELRAVGVDADFIRRLREQGMEKLSVEQLVRLRVSGVDADFIRDMRKPRK